MLYVGGDVIAVGPHWNGSDVDFGIAVLHAGLSERVYYQQDANHNVTSITDEQGAVLQRAVYTPYGERTVLAANFTGTSDAYGLLQGHQGGRYDAVTGLYHFRMRDYDPSMGTWMEADPIGYPDGVNRYTAYTGNPIRWLDSMGLEEAGMNHGYPLHLGGSNTQPLWDFTKVQHTAFHDYFRAKGFGYGDAGRAAWKALTAREQQAHIMRALRAAGVCNSVIQKHIGAVLKDAIPGVKTTRVSTKVPIIGGLVFTIALIVLTDPSVAYAAEISLHWRDADGHNPSRVFFQKDPNEKKLVEGADFIETKLVPSWWNVFGDPVSQGKVQTCKWLAYDEMTAREAIAMEGASEWREVATSDGYTIMQRDVSRVRWGGEE